MSGDCDVKAIDHFETTVRRALRAAPEGLLLVAVSGGADSCAMFAALARIAGSRVVCAHIVHGIRPDEEGEADAAHVRSLCKTFSVPLEMLAVPRGAVSDRARATGKGVEDAARSFRHAFLRETADKLGARRILLGHTADDLLETVLIRLLRGSGPAGLAAMPESNGRILRPILRLSRADVVAYLNALGLSYKEDSTNSDLRYARNRIRARLVPLLDAEFPSWKSALRSVASTQAEVARFIAAEADRRIAWNASAEHPAALRTDEGAFFASDPVLRIDALYRAADAVVLQGRKLGPLPAVDAPARKDRTPTRRAVERFVSGMEKAQNFAKYRVFRSAGSVILQSSLDAGWVSGGCLVIDGAGVFRLPSCGVVVSDSDPDSATSIPVALPLAVRSPRRADTSSLAAVGLTLKKGEKALNMLEDALGLAGVVCRCRDGSLKLAPVPRKGFVSDYAHLKFFSIL